MEYITLSLDDINSSETLQKLGVRPGDKVDENNKLIRVFSRDEDEIKTRITDQDIASSPTLQKLGAKSGDFVTSDDRLISSAEQDAWTAFSYATKKGEDTGYLDYALDTLITHLPTAGNIIDFGLDYISDNIFSNPFASWDNRQKQTSLFKYKSADEKYGKGFTEAEPSQRREMILRQKERELQREFPGYKPTGGVAEVLGEMYGSLKDPTTLIPIGGGLGNVALKSAALAGSYSAIQDVATKGEIDPYKAGMFAATGAVLPYAVVGGVKAAPKVAEYTKEVIGKATGLSGEKGSAKLVNKAQALIASKQANGVSVTEDMMPSIAEELKVSPSKLEAAFTTQKVQPRFYDSVDEAEKAVMAAVAEDSAVLRTVSKGADRVLGILSTRIKEIDDGVFGRLMRTEFNLFKRTQDYLKRVDGFVEGVEKLPEVAKNELNYLLGSGKHEQARAWMASNAPELIPHLDETLDVLGELGTSLTKAGHKADVENYFPRSVKDIDTLHKALGADEVTIFQDEFNRTAARKGKEVNRLTQNEKDRAIERVLKKKDEASISMKTPGQVQKRTMDEALTVDLMKHYRSPGEALQRYVRSSVNHLERKKFFKDYAVEDLTDESGINLNESIATMVKKLMDEGRITREQSVDLADMLGSRFGSADTPMSAGLSGLKNIGYIGTLGDFMSTLTQAADVTNIMGYHGFKNTVAAAVGKKNIVLDDIGLANNIAKELDSVGKFSKTLNKLLELTQFKRIDRFGKETLMNAVQKKYTKQLASNQGVETFRNKWKDVYGPDIDQLITDLQRGDKTELSNLHFFTKLSEHQPISHSEYPQAYLNSPNGRILYMLKSFTLKQWDLVRRNIINEAKNAPSTMSGKKKAALAGVKLGKVALFMSAGGLGVDKTKDFILGRDVKPEDIPTDAMWSLLGAYGLNKYGASELKKGNVTGFADNLLTVPVPVFDGIQQLLTGDYERAAKHIPVVGRTVHSRFLGGAEKENKRRMKERLD